MPMSPQTRTAKTVGSLRIVRMLAWVVILGGALVVLRSLPLAQVMDLVQQKVTTFGPWGPVVFGGAYILAGLLFVPGSALTLAAGALFGLIGGTITVSLASTTVAGLAFLIARYAARDKVQAMARTNRTFAAIDRAIAQGGWRIIALLRLSPAVPFSLGNYLYGLTPVRFWPYLIASWVCMLPGTFLYVYLGFVGAQAAGTGGGGKNPWQWVLLGVGLLATVVVTVYVTRLARRALKDTALSASEESSITPSDEPSAGAKGGKPVAVLLVVTAVVACLAVVAWMNKAWLGGLLGPPKVTLVETYQNTSGGPVFDHARFDAILHSHVSPGGWVDYEALGKEAGELDEYISTLARAKPDELGRDERLALLINAYNAFTLRLILDHDPVASIKDIPANERWDAARWNLAGETYSLNQIEHELIRPRFAEPRVHFALVCAAVGCPPLRGEAYAGGRLEAQLADQSVYVHSHARWLRTNAESNEVELTSLYDWYGSDFTQVVPTILDFAARYSPEVAAMMRSGRSPSVRFLEYNWAINSVTNKAEENE